MGKSLVSYVAGYAICGGYIDNINVKLDDWPVLNGTLYEGQKLIDILNMQAGDQKFIGEKNYNSDNRIKDQRFLNVNTYPLKEIMELDILQTSKIKAIHVPMRMSNHGVPKMNWAKMVSDPNFTHIKI